MQNRCDPHHRFGRSYRFSEQDLLDLDAQTAVPPPPAKSISWLRRADSADRQDHRRGQTPSRLISRP